MWCGGQPTVHGNEGKRAPQLSQIANANHAAGVHDRILQEDLAVPPGGGSDSEPSFPLFPSVGFSGQKASGNLTEANKGNEGPSSAR